MKMLKPLKIRHFLAKSSKKWRLRNMIKVLFICHGTILTIEKNAVFTRVAEFL